MHREMQKIYLHLQSAKIVLAEKRRKSDEKNFCGDDVLSYASANRMYLSGR